MTKIDALREDVSSYLRDVLNNLQPEVVTDGALLANELFSLLTSRAFCYLSRTKVDPYREAAIASLQRRIAGVSRVARESVRGLLPPDGLAPWRQPSSPRYAPLR